MTTIIFMPPSAELPVGFPLPVAELPDVQSLMRTFASWLEGREEPISYAAYRVDRHVLTVLDAIYRAADDGFRAQLPAFKRLVGTPDLPDAAWAQAAAAFGAIALPELMATRATAEGESRLTPSRNAVRPDRAVGYDALLKTHASTVAGALAASPNTDEDDDA